MASPAVPALPDKEASGHVTGDWLGGREGDPRTDGGACGQAGEDQSSF